MITFLRDYLRIIYDYAITFLGDNLQITNTRSFSIYTIIDRRFREIAGLISLLTIADVVYRNRHIPFRNNDDYSVKKPAAIILF